MDIEPKKEDVPVDPNTKEISPENLFAHTDVNSDGKVDIIDYYAHILYHQLHPELGEKYFVQATKRLQDVGLMDEVKPAEVKAESVQLKEYFQPSTKSYGGWYDPVTDKYHRVERFAEHTKWVCQALLAFEGGSKLIEKYHMDMGVLEDVANSDGEDYSKFLDEGDSDKLYNIAELELNLVRIVTNPSMTQQETKLWSMRDIGIEGLAKNVKIFIEKYSREIGNFCSKVYIDLRSKKDGSNYYPKKSDRGVFTLKEPKDSPKLTKLMMNESFRKKIIQEVSSYEARDTFGNYGCWYDVRKNEVIKVATYGHVQHILDVVKRDGLKNKNYEKYFRRAREADQGKTYKDTDQMKEVTQQLYNYGIFELGLVKIVNGEWTDVNVSGTVKNVQMFVDRYASFITKNYDMMYVEEMGNDDNINRTIRLMGMNAATLKTEYFGIKLPN